jgi:hypothetical protein
MQMLERQYHELVTIEMFHDQDSEWRSAGFETGEDHSLYLVLRICRAIEF